MGDVKVSEPAGRWSCHLLRWKRFQAKVALQIRGFVLLPHMAIKDPTSVHLNPYILPHANSCLKFQQNQLPTDPLTNNLSDFDIWDYPKLLK